MTVKKKPPTPRRAVYDTYWKYAAERQEVWDRRYNNEPAPWTDDPILLKHKFTSVFRAADRVSQYMIRNVCYHDEPCSDADRLFQIVMFRTFSKNETWEKLHEKLGHYPLLKDLACDDLEKALTEIAEDNTIYTSAFILCANDAYHQGKKHLNHLALFRDMFLVHDLADDLQKAKSLRKVNDLLKSYPLMGDFMSFQTAIDLNYSDLINFDENDFVVAGPGARRGIDKCFESRGDYSYEEIVMMMVKNQDKEFARLSLEWNGLFGRKMHAIDCQNVFCETDKYSRVAFPELASNRVRIKQQFHETRTPIEYFFPPKWKLKLPRRKIPESLAEDIAGQQPLF